MCAAQACAQNRRLRRGALLRPDHRWSLSNNRARVISGIYYAAYTLVVPLLSSLTDRVDPSACISARRADRDRLRRLRMGRDRFGRRWRSGR